MRRLALAAVAVGLIAGVLAALLAPERSESAGSFGPITIRPAFKPILDSGVVQLRAVPGTVKIEQRRADPRGGPPFAIRVFRAERLALPPGSRDLAKARLLGHPLCAQLGRIYKGRFGWIDARNVFRPVGIDYFHAPIRCGDRWRDERSDPQLSVTTLITDPLKPSATPLQSIVWGIAGGLTKSVTLDGVPHDERTPSASARGAFLAFGEPETSPYATSATIDYRGRKSITATFAGRYGLGAPAPHGRVPERAAPGSEQIEARAPDPAGDVPWAITAFRSAGGDYCAGTSGRLVGRLVGGVDFGLGTFSESPPSGHCFGLPSKLPRTMAVGLSTSGENAPPRLSPEAEPDSSRIRLRTLRGRTTLSGVAKAAVREVTIQSPRDVRTVVPSPRAHVFLVVYDGVFPAGEFVVTSTLADGSKVKQTMPAGF
jgi:hypothetical protein